MQGPSLVHPGDHLVLGAVEAVDPDDAGLLLGVGVVRVGGVEIVLKDSQPVEVLDLGGGHSARHSGDDTAMPPASPPPRRLPCSHPMALALLSFGAGGAAGLVEGAAVS